MGAAVVFASLALAVWWLLDRPWPRWLRYDPGWGYPRRARVRHWRHELDCCRRERRFAAIRRERWAVMRAVRAVQRARLRAVWAVRDVFDYHEGSWVR